MKTFCGLAVCRRALASSGVSSFHQDFSIDPSRRCGNTLAVRRRYSPFICTLFSLSLTSEKLLSSLALLSYPPIVSMSLRRSISSSHAWQRIHMHAVVDQLLTNHRRSCRTSGYIYIGRRVRCRISEAGGIQEK
jgi:hypothetical protein